MAAPCPICQIASDEKYRPFCSKRCADIDLGRWFDGTYTLADQETSQDDVVPETETEQAQH
ncbi:DNA gyrase inhibitor YacG [Halocynthiibacter namhaensis]|uniref:DNA gyrase inhibitor YacG n=1 Tax=Halocynthiibacter namhaensis TaxID=1290553 RepID=UPI000578F735|nr:DNA gyrase inhibitor YacG [Halocynthiibacter namhaensis]